jgi:xanthine dehydrogenase YagR molybdenum-binding subunit
MALHEETVIDNRYGHFNNHNFAGFHVPVNADVYDVEVIFVDAREPHLDFIGVKRIGKIGIVGRLLPSLMQHHQ